MDQNQIDGSYSPERESHLPCSPEAERGVLGCVLLDSNCLAECVERLYSSQDFYDLRHQVVYDAMLEMFDSRTPIDSISLHDKLIQKNVYEQCGGIGYVASLPDVVPSVANVGQYLSIVADKAQLRRLIGACASAVSSATRHEGDSRQVVERHEQEIHALMSRQPSPMLTVKEAVRQVIEHIELLHAKQGADGLPTGLMDLDRLTCGLHNQDMIVVAGRPSVGKTALAMNIVEHLAVDQRVPVGVFSMEMSTKSLVMRMLCARARVDAQRIRQGQLVESDFPKLAAAAKPISTSPLHIDDTAGMSIVLLRSKARRMHQLYGIKLLVIDYLQLMNSGKQRSEGRQQEVAGISAGVKGLARDLNIPVIVLSQLNRDMEKGGGSGPRKPRLSDLRDSGAVEQDADVVMLLWKPDEETPEGVELVLAKQRNGPTGDVPLLYLRDQTRFVSAARE